MFIVFEGIDGSGKSSVISRLKDNLESYGKKVIVTAEPSRSDIGNYVLRTRGLNPKTEALLFTADRSEHTEQILDWIRGGYIVICDRYIGSTLAYQSAAGMNINWLKDINSGVAIIPDVTILMDIDPEISLRRVNARGERTRFEKLNYLKKVRNAYLSIAKEFNFRVVNADRDRDTVANEVKNIVWEVLRAPV